MTSEVATSSQRQRRQAARIITITLVIGYAITIALGLVGLTEGAVPAALGSVVLFAASLIAASLCVAAARSVAPPNRLPWVLFAIAAALASLAHVFSASAILHAVWFASHIVLLGGFATAAYQAEAGRRVEFSLDIALIVTAAGVLVARWAAGVHESARLAETNATLLLIMFAPVTALAALPFGAVLVAGVRETAARGAVVAISAAIGALAISAIPHALSGGVCCHAGTWTVLGAIGAWVFIAIAATIVWRDASWSSPARARDRLRQIVAPTVAVILAIISFEIALNPLEPRTAVALGVLGALVALRLSELLNATRQQASERRELAKTKALMEVTRALAGKNELDSTLRTVTQWAVRVTNARAAVIELLAADGQTLVLQAAEGLPDHAIGMSFPVETSFTGRVVLTGEPRVTTNAARDPDFRADSLELLGDSPVAAMPLRYRERLLGVLSCIGNQPFDDDDLEMLHAFADQAAIALEDARLFEQVHALSVTDPLTGLANRRQLDRDLEREFAAATRGRRLFAVMFDLDDFKQHNDTYGHLAGDQVLQRFGEALKSMTRAMNLAARYGGDEFCALLADSDSAGASTFAERVKERFYRAMDDAGAPSLRVSAGIAEYHPGMKTPEDLIGAADRALYAAKSSARVNR